MSQTFRLFFLVLYFSFFYSFAQTNYVFEIDSLLKVKEPRMFNGVVLITKNGKPQYSRAYGFKKINNPAPLQQNDQFEIMSNTKQVTAVLILKEAEKGKIDLQSAIRRYLPTLTQTWADSVTVHQLLNHTHGITDIEKPLSFKPGSEFKYGNLSNILLGKILENVTGQPYRQLADHLFHQLGMKDTFCYSKENQGKLVSGHLTNGHIFTTVEESFINDENLPADGVISTAKDLSLWNDQLHKGKILGAQMYNLMTAPSAMSQHDVFGKDKNGYGYNIRIVNDQDTKYFGHTGLGDGFASLNIYIPESDVSIIVLENQMNDDSNLYYYFEKEIKDIILRSNLLKK
ncbi:CubicO group peptidase, beta-lactamase class C family [Chryseobacterium arachidis]|uniref:CubicO group peptidase, beta-lactamase class C family n=1 Tax=Chryseobacterium arachidis TaxID=1416778 RepID=A0A1M4UFM1_9FLAO|nr:serine hydrolase domain-containing protein [Chryseobacterium arachidis]SHE55496.1 CubicO group peptidase, beta-lactamase class C family [Chryseobacterium arachidis]